MALMQQIDAISSSQARFDEGALRPHGQKTLTATVRRALTNYAVPGVLGACGSVSHGAVPSDVDSRATRWPNGG